MFKCDRVFVNGHFTTMNPNEPVTSALAIYNGRIIATGADAEDTPAREVIDLHGQYVVPGFHDAHMHFSQVGDSLQEIDLHYEAAPSIDAVYEQVREKVRQSKPGEWVKGWGFDQNKIGGYPILDVLDTIAPENPLYLGHISGHMAVTNSLGLARAGFTDPDSAPNPDGGVIVRDANGHVTGLMQERANQILRASCLPGSGEELIESLRLASEYAASFGITSFTEPGIGTSHGIGHGPFDLHFYQQAIERGLLRIRATVMPYITALHDVPEVETDADAYGLDLGLRTGIGDDRLRIGAVKVMTDGSLIGLTAAVLEPYRNHSHDDLGVFQWNPEELRERLIMLHRYGWQIAAHAIGDAAVEEALKTFELAQKLYPRPDVRHRIEHAGITNKDQVARIAKLGIVPDPQGALILETGDGFITALGEERAAMAYRMKSFIDAGAVIPGSSDGPVVTINPLVGMQSMVLRRTAGGIVLNASERVSIDQALRAYTYGSAYASHQEQYKGLLAPGYLADFAVLSEPLLSVSSENIGDIRVLQTYVGGECIFDRN